MLMTILAGFLAATPAQPNVDLVVREPPDFQRLLRWKDGWVTKADRLYAVDPNQVSLEPFEHAGVDVVLEMAESPGASFVFGLKGKKARLVSAKSTSQNPEIALPAEVLRSPTAWRLAVGGDRVVLLGSKLAFSCNLPHCKWSRTKIRQDLWSGRGGTNEPRAILVYGSQVFVAVNQGEWGGGLWSLALTTGEVSLVEGDSEPATGLALDDEGRVWATWGLAHGVSKQGTLRILEGGKWKLISRTDNLDRKRQENWLLPPTSFESVAIDRGRVFLLTSTLGVVELVDGSWRQRTTDWPGDEYVYALGVQTDTAFIVISFHRVLVWNLRSGAKRVLRMRSAPSR